MISKKQKADLAQRDADRTERIASQRRRAAAIGILANYTPTVGEYDPKPMREEDKEYLAFIRIQPCAIGYACHGPVHAHHDTTKGSGGSDRTALPLCALHHASVHNLGRVTFWKVHHKDADALKRHYRAAYARLAVSRE